MLQPCYHPISATVAVSHLSVKCVLKDNEIKADKSPSEPFWLADQKEESGESVLDKYMRNNMLSVNMYSMQSVD